MPERAGSAKHRALPCGFHVPGVARGGPRSKVAKCDLGPSASGWRMPRCATGRDGAPGEGEYGSRAFYLLLAAFWRHGLFSLPAANCHPPAGIVRCPLPFALCSLPLSLPAAPCQLPARFCPPELSNHRTIEPPNALSGRRLPSASCSLPAGACRSDAPSCARFSGPVVERLGEIRLWRSHEPPFSVEGGLTR